MVQKKKKKKTVWTPVVIFCVGSAFKEKNGLHLEMTPEEAQFPSNPLHSTDRNMYVASMHKQKRLCCNTLH